MSVAFFSRKITDILDAMAPVKTFQVKNHFAPWLSKETVRLMKVRYELHKIASETKNRDDWNRSKHMINRINNRLKYEEGQWQKVRLDDYGKDSAKVWKNVKGILNWQSSGTPNKLFYKGSLRTKSQDIADLQN